MDKRSGATLADGCPIRLQRLTRDKEMNSRLVPWRQWRCSGVFVVQNNTELQRYEIFEAGERAGFVQYEMHDGDMWVLFTQMRRKFKSVSRATKAMGFILKDARRRRIRVVPFCPAFRVFMCQHPSNPALLPEEWRDRVAGAIDEEQEETGKTVLKYVRFTGSPWRKSAATQHAVLAA
jgi:predicted GNAT family acetyltransferase